jgi:5-phospho-D-xylono-1,4-lactonase
MQFFRTVNGDVSVDDMGMTYAHEHIVIEESTATIGNNSFILNDVEKISQELKGLHDAGCCTMIDTMPVNAGRNAIKLAEISRKTGMQIVVPTGIHLEKYYSKYHWRYQYTEEQLSTLFVADIEEGIDRYDYNGPLVDRSVHRAGLVKLATGDEAITTHQEIIFRAVVNTHLETGVPILTHTNNGLNSIEQVERFAKLGAKLDHVVLSHVDKIKDLGLFKSLLETGVYVEFDSAFRWKPDQENNTFKLLEHFSADYANQITLGMDAARNIYWRSYGGKPGLDYWFKQGKEELEKRGLMPYFDTYFFKNPKHLYAFWK